MNQKYKLKKSAIIIILTFLILIIAIILFIISLFKTKSYSLEYNIDDYKISENYDDKKEIFYYEITADDIIYSFITNSKYLKNRELVESINSFDEQEYTCITIESQYIKTNPLCSKEKELIDFRLIPDELKEQLSDYYEEQTNVEEKINNYTLYNKDIDTFIWSYKGFNHLKGEYSNRIDLFSKDIYAIPLATKINDYIFIPDYEQEYNFNQVYIININNNKVEKWQLKYNISYDSYIAGINDKSIYLIDKKNKIEYELVPHKQKMRILASKNKQGTIYQDGETKKIPLDKIISEETKFTYLSDYHYEINDNNLYLTYLNKNNKIRVSNQKISLIIATKNDELYYLVKDTLYKYNIKYGETKLIKYSEWEFNNANSIFIND